MRDGLSVGQIIEKHSVRATLRKLGWDRACGFARLTVGNLRLNSFIPYMFSPEEMDLIGSFRKKEVEVVFSLCDFGLDATTERTKKIDGPKRWLTEYDIQGEVIDRFPSSKEPKYQTKHLRRKDEFLYSLLVVDRSPSSKKGWVNITYLPMEYWDDIVVDCGIPVVIGVKPGAFKVGDWLRGNGRLDISFPAKLGDSIEPRFLGI